MMRVLTAGPREVELDRGALHALPAAQEVVIAVERVGVCGSDAHVYEGTHPYLAYPQIQGHEVVGRIVAVGKDVMAARIGERVVLEPTVPCGHCAACRRGSPNCCVRLDVMGVTLPGGLSETLTVPVSMVHGVGDLEPDIAVLVEPLAIAVHAVARAEVRPGERVVVIGAGSIGRSVVLAALDRDASVLVVERTPGRAKLLEHLDVALCSADEADVRRSGREFAGADGPGVVIDSTGSGELIRLAVDLVAHSGRVVVIGISQDDLTVPVALLTRKEASILGSRNSDAEFPLAIDIARRNAAALGKMITARLPLAEAENAFRSVLERTSLGKVIVVVDGA
jgi:L-gulonate 5-dehydrogenase